VTLAQFSRLVAAPSKWVLNARALLGLQEPYSAEAAEGLAIIRVLNSVFGMQLGTAAGVATQALDHDETARIASPDGIVTVEVDMERLRSAVATRMSAVANTYAPRRPGPRPRRSRAPIDAAEQYGIDIGLLKANLARTPETRLRQLDAMASFRSRVRRRDAR
jgi:hypothetical protein